jgi:hypothetical protein
MREEETSLHAHNTTNLIFMHAGHAWILTSLMELSPVSLISQDKMISIASFGTTFKVDTLSHEHWISTWPMIFLAQGPSLENSQTQNGREVQGGTGVCLWGVSPRTSLASLLGVYSTLFQTEMFAILAYGKDCIQKAIQVIICICAI